MKTAKFSRILSVLALILVATMLLTLVSCGDEPAENTDTTPGGDTTTAPSASVDANGSETDPSETDPSDTETSATDSTASSSSSATGSKPTGISKTNNGKTSSITKKTSATTRKTVSADENVLKQAANAGIKGNSISMMVWWTPGADDKAEAATFEKETGCKVSYQTSSMSTYTKTLSAKIMSKNAPDIAAMINEWYPQPITRGMFQPLDEVKVNGINFKDKDVFALSMMDQFGYKGRHYGIALKGSTQGTFTVMFYNESILKKQGVKEDPAALWAKGKWNWDTCLEIAQKCTVKSKGLSGITNTYQYYWMLSAGEDFVKSTKAGLKANASSAGVEKAWRWNWNLVNQYKVIDTSYTAQTPFLQGKAAMFGSGSYMMQAEKTYNYVPQNMKDPWGVVPFPSPAGKSFAGCQGTVFGFPAAANVKGKDLEAAAWYLRYFLDDATYSDPNFYPTQQCWDVMEWMWKQTIISYNSAGVLTYGGEYKENSIQYDVLDMAESDAAIASKLKSWDGVLQTNIDAIAQEMGA